MLRYDLHCHSTSSDGLLAAHQVVARAAARGVDVLALTDHDTVDGLAEAQAAAREHGVRLVNGAEISVSWERHTLHVVALNIDPASPALAQGLERIRSGRTSRARRIANSLAECGIRGAYEGALAFVTNEALVSRTHFARFLVEAGYVKDVKDVFNRYLVPGKPGYVAHEWATLTQAIDWIHVAGGQAVLAHPARYKVSKSALRRLLSEFRELGGGAIEVFSPSHTRDECEQFITLSRVYGLLASVGSDYHGASESAVDLGDLPALPAGSSPVWQAW